MGDDVGEVCPNLRPLYLPLQVVHLGRSTGHVISGREDHSIVRRASAVLSASPELAGSVKIFPGSVKICVNGECTLSANLTDSEGVPGYLAHKETPIPLGTP